MSGAPPSGPQPTGPQPPTAPPPAPAQPGFTRGQRVALWIAGLAALAAVLATALVAVLPPQRPRLAPTPTTPNLAQITYHATQTAQAFQLTQPYNPQGIGPCDTVDPPFSKQNASYWQWDTNPGDLRCDLGGVTRMYSNSYLAFYGFPEGFPQSFTATLTLVFDSRVTPPDGGSCLTYSLTFDGGTQGLSLCDNGAWQSTQYSGINGYVQVSPGAPFVLMMRVSPTGVAFSVNNAQTTPPFYRGSINDISLTAFTGLPPGSSVAVLSFALTPLT